MSLNGNGTYSPPAPQFPAIPNTIIYADDFNQIILDIATAISTAIFRDGQAAFTADQSLGGNKLTNVKNGTNPQDATTVLQVFTDPTFSGTTADGVKIVGTKLTVATATAALPAGTAIGTVTAAEIARLAGVTSNIQDQIDAKANLAGGNTFTGTQNLTAALADGSTAVTQPSGDASTKVATTAFVTAAAFNAALPDQTGNTGKYVTTDGTNASWAAIIPPQVIRNTQAAGYTALPSDNQKLIDWTGSSNATLAFTAAATLGDGWYCWVRNSGTADLTLDPNGAERIDGLTSFIMYPGEVRLVQCDSTAFNSLVLHPFSRTFTTSGMFTKPPGYSYFGGLLWGGGGGGGKSGYVGTSANSSGGGGGACVPFVLPSSSVGATQAVMIGAGGFGSSASASAAQAGGNSVFSTVTAYGGGGGYGDNSRIVTGGGGGGGALSAGSSGSGSNNQGHGGDPQSYSGNGGPYFHNHGFGGGAGCGNSAYGGAGGHNSGSGAKSLYGGGGGGSANGTNAYSGGASVFGGAGGAGSASDNAGNGTAPGGGGGATGKGTAGNGARGELRLWGIV